MIKIEKIDSFAKNREYPPTPPQWQAISITGADILVAAAAGSGKTEVLSERIARKVACDRWDIDKMLVLTFTTAAAKNMLVRIENKITERLLATELEEDRLFLRKQRMLMNNALVTTIDSFCLSVLKKFYYLVEEKIDGEYKYLSPNFSVLPNSKNLLVDAINEVIEQFAKEDKNITFHFNTKIDCERFEGLRKNYDKVLVATGAQIENTYGFEPGNGLYAGLTLLYDLNIRGNHEYYKKYKKAMVWGGGNVAMDCARSLVRIIDDVSVVYRRSEEEITANKSEIRDARNENVKFNFLCNVKRVLRDDSGAVTGAQLIRQELGEPDSSGRRSPQSVPGSEFNIDADIIVMAIGQKVDLSELAEDLKITENYRTTLENVFIAGDANVGPATIGKALMEGRAVAAEMQKA